MNFVIDTVALSDFFNNEPKAVKAVRAAEVIYIPVIVIGEFKAGIYGGSHKKKNLEVLASFLSKSRSTVLQLDHETAEQYARLRTYLRSKGMPIPTNDLWIAALCTQYDLPLLTRDSDFKNLPQLTLL